MTLSSPVSCARSRGFSLVEVCFALAVVSFALTTIMGLLPSGLNMLHQGAKLTTEAQIMQSLSGEVQMLDYSKVARYRTTALSPTFPVTMTMREKSWRRLRVTAPRRIPFTKWTLRFHPPHCQMVPAA